MNTKPWRNYPRSASSRERGLTLLETLVYLSLLSLIMVLSYECYYHTEEMVRRMNRNCDDIMAVQRAGESWRNAVRHAQNKIQLTVATNGTDQVVTIPGTNGPTLYRFREDTIWVQSPDDATERAVLNRVLSSQWVEDKDPTSQGWRWEIELKPIKKSAQIRPLFTFLSIAQKESIR